MGGNGKGGSEASTRLSAGLAAGDNVASRVLARTILADPDALPADHALAELTLKNLAPDRLALLFFAGALCIWITAFVLGIVVRQG